MMFAPRPRIRETLDSQGYMYVCKVGFLRFMNESLHKYMKTCSLRKSLYRVSSHFKQNDEVRGSLFGNAICTRQRVTDLS